MTLTRNSAVESHLDERAPDIASELLVAQLALNDIVTAQTTRKGKAREGTPRSDRDMALDLQAACLSAFMGVLQDHQFAASMDRAIESDARLLERLADIERAERDDHRTAVALTEGHDLPRQTSSQRTMDRILGQPARAHASTSRGRASNVTAEADMGSIAVGVEDIHIAPVTSETVPWRSFRIPDTRFECVICGDTVFASRSFKAPCPKSHRYCRGCIVSLVETYLRDEKLHPLRCCQQPLPLASESGVFRFIPASLQCQFHDKHREYSTPAASRVYCSNPRCSAFLGRSGDARSTLTCDICNSVTCSECKNNAHPGEDCSELESTLELRETAMANKWQTCPGCHTIVELSQGCYHMTCRCSTQFCYLCSARWKTCDCLQWDEDRLLDDAERRLRNEFGDWVAEEEPEVHAELVYQRMEDLRERHECQDHSWRFRHGAGVCEECGDLLPVFLMCCIHCQALACRRCSVNRL